MIPSFEDFEPLYPADVLQKRIAELGQQISSDLADSENLVVVCVLKGAIVFMADLIRCFSSTFPPQTRSRKACRWTGSSISLAFEKISTSFTNW